jgi:hypothetical protein
MKTAVLVCVFTVSFLVIMIVIIMIISHDGCGDVGMWSFDGYMII